MKNSDLAIILVGLSYIWLVATVLIGASNYPNYSHISQFMSELGAQGAPSAQQYVNLAGFFVVEVILLAGLWFASSTMPKSGAVKLGLVIFLVYPIFISIAAFSPCDFECRPDDPTFTHTIHIGAGLMAYLLAILGLATMTYYSPSPNPEKPHALKRLTYICSPVLLICLMNITPDNSYVGLVQRAMETGIYSWLLYLLIHWRNLSLRLNHNG